ncbi:MAG: hypothetical protein AAGD35_07760 [Actinomycetota bacterium]
MIEAPYRPADDATLRGQWQRAFGRYDNADVAFARVLAAYRRPDRYYHTIEHGLEVADTVRALATAFDGDDADREALDGDDLDDVLLAAWTHDAVYDRDERNNEQRSAALAWELALLLGFDLGRADAVADLVLVTTHTTPPTDHRQRMICDADLSVLAKPWDDYADDVANIRAELGITDGDQWRATRTRMLGFFERRPSLYLLPEAVRRWETVARANQRNERRLLAAADR